jgi:hypothetical protein
MFGDAFWLLYMLKTREEKTSFAEKVLMSYQVSLGQIINHE